MAVKSVVHIGENSPEQVAFNLMEKIANAEKMVFHNRPDAPYTTADRKWILSTYKECLNAIRTA